MELLPRARRGTKGQAAARVFPVVIGCCLLFSSRAWGDARQFIPKYVSFSGDFGVGSLYEWDKAESTTTYNRSDLTIQEGVSVEGLGYIYSPLFISLLTDVTLGLEQEQLDNNGEKSSYYDGNANQFKQVFKILPSHPYNLELYFLRETPMTAGTAGRGGSVAIYEEGARARYEERPWSSTLSFTNHDSSSDLSSNNQSLLYNLNYFQSGTSASGSYNHNTSSTLDGADSTVRDMYNLSLAKKLETMRFFSRWTRDGQQQEENFPGLPESFAELSRDEAYGEADFELPYHFDTMLSFLQTDRESTYVRETGSIESFTESRNYSFRLHHRLYTSLNTSFSAGQQTTDAASGNMDQQNYRLNLDYDKKIPWGNLGVGMWNGLSFIKNTGAPVTLFETHNITAGLNYFSLNYQTIDPSTIQVSLIDANNNDHALLLVEGVHYQVTRFATSFRITITSLPLDQLVAPVGNLWDYAYRVDYAFHPADYDLRGEDWGSSLQAALFHNLITPHYSYGQSDQQVTAGNYPGVPGQSKAHSLGLGFGLGPCTGDVTRSWLRSNTTDEDRLTTFVAYSREISTFTSGHLTLSYEDVQTTQFELGSVGPTTTLSEQFYSALAQIQTVLPQQNLNASLATNYTLYEGVGKATSISLFSNLTWHIGLLDVNLSASYTTSDAKVDESSTKRQYAMVRLMLKRKLF